MGATGKLRCAALLLTIVALGVSLGLPAEDVLDVVYDESEPMPYQAAIGFSVVLPQTFASIANTISHSPVLSGGPPTECTTLCPESNPKKRGVSDSLTIMNHSLRC
jgi:hypothetical protein